LLWGGTAPPQRPHQGPLKLLRKGSIRAKPAGPADVAVRLLLQHADWWQQLAGDDQQMLHELSGSHGDVVRWLEQQSEEQGPLPWAVLFDAMQAESWASEAQQWVLSGLGDEEYTIDGLQRVIAKLWHELLKQEADAIVAGTPSTEDLQRYKALMEQIATIKATGLTQTG
jgi:DNA primase